MSARTFFDTNVLLYLVTDTARADDVTTLLSEGGVISVQVLNEFANVARRKYAAPWDRLSDVLAVLRATLDVRPLDLQTHLLGIEVAQRYGYSVYDSLLLAAARLADCETMWWEDMKHGQRIDGVLTIRNPFAA